MIAVALPRSGSLQVVHPRRRVRNYIKQIISTGEKPPWLKSLQQWSSNYVMTRSCR